MTRAPIGSKAIVQVCFVTAKLERSATWFGDLLGLPVPEFITSGAREEAATEYLGQPSDARCRMAFFKLDNLDIELIEPDGRPSCWREFLDRNGPGVHHLAFRVNGMAATIEGLEARGLALLQKGEFSGGRYAYIDTEAHMGVLTELLEFDHSAS